MIPVLMLAFALPLSEPAVTVRVLSYNIHHGRGADGAVDLDRIARVVAAAKPDVVALQEVDVGVRRSGRIDQPAELGRLTGLTPYFRENIPYQGGQYGNAVLSRWPATVLADHKLPSHHDGEQRGVLELRIDVPGAAMPLHFLATHLDSRAGSTERPASVAFLEALVEKRPTADFVLAGDLNALPDSPEIRRLRRSWTLAGDGRNLLTFPAAKPRRRIDYIAVRPVSRWTVERVVVIDEPVASDHRPVLAELTWSPGQ